MKILLLDIETSPNTAHVWGLYNQNVSLNQLMESSYVMCWAAKWLGEEEIYFDSIMESKHKSMIKKIHALLDECDAVIHYNGTKFDIPTLNKEFLLAGLAPPSPYKEIDLLRTSRSKFKFPSNKLDYVAQALGLGEKVKHIGHELWIKCMNKDKQAWDMMKKYNIQDVALLEKVYVKMLAWVKLILIITHTLMTMYVLIVEVLSLIKEVSNFIQLINIRGTYVSLARLGVVATNHYKWENHLSCKYKGNNGYRRNIRSYD
jgi:DNA polymerase elongation subunit (family B)